MTIDGREHNHITVDFEVTPILPEYALGQETRYTVYFTCDNGFQRIGPLTFGPHWVSADRGGMLYWDLDLPAGTTDGHCRVTTFDHMTFGLIKTHLERHSGSTTATTNYWNIAFSQY